MSAVTGPGFAAFSAAIQGDWERANAAVDDIPQEEWLAFVRAVTGLRNSIRAVPLDAPRKHRVCDNCLMANHTGCTDPCGCTAPRPVDPPAPPE